MIMLVLAMETYKHVKRAQAFVIVLASGLVLLSSIFLSIYYLCAIRYNMSQETFQKYAEPILLLIAMPILVISTNHLCHERCIQSFAI